MKHCFVNQLLWVAGYTILLVSAGYLVHLASALLKIARNKSDPTAPRRKRILRSSLGLLATGVCFAFFYDSMFVRFSCVEVGSNQITLKYFWPKPQRVIVLNELTHVEIERDRKQRGELVVVSNHGENRSVVCTKGVNLEQARDAIQALLQSRTAGK